MSPMLYGFVFGIKAPKCLGLGAGRARNVLLVSLVFDLFLLFLLFFVSFFPPWFLAGSIIMVSSLQLLENC